MATFASVHEECVVATYTSSSSPIHDTSFKGMNTVIRTIPFLKEQ
jgi:hypothetical protein